MPKARDESMLRADQSKLLIAIGNAGMDLQQLSKVSGVSYSVICLMRRGRLMKPWKLGKVCKALGVRIEDVVQEEGGQAIEREDMPPVPEV